MDFSKIEGFDWDQGNLEHIKKHNVEYTECEEVFSNGPFAGEDKNHSQSEIRFQALGETNNGRLLFVSFTIRENESSSSSKKIRVISARDQSKKEKANQRIGGELN